MELNTTDLMDGLKRVLADGPRQDFAVVLSFEDQRELRIAGYVAQPIRPCLPALART